MGKWLNRSGNFWYQIESMNVLRVNYGLDFAISPRGPCPSCKGLGKIVAKKCCHLLSLQKEGTQSVLLFVCLPCTAALRAPRGRMGYKISQSYLQIVRYMNLWQQFEFGFPTGSNPAPPNLLKSTLASPVWNTGDKLVCN